MNGPFDSGFPGINLIVDAPFPAAVSSGPGIEVSKNNPVNWQVSLDYPDLVESTNVAAGQNYYTAVYDAVNDSYWKVRLDNLDGAISGADQRAAVADANYTVQTADRYVGLTVALTVDRTITLPLANSVPAGRQLVLQDEVGGLSGTHAWVVQRQGSDTIDGGTAMVLSGAYSGLRLISDGSSRWSVATRPALQNVSDVNYTVRRSDEVVAYTAMTLPRSVFLPAASVYPRGQRLLIVDSEGVCNTTNTITVMRNGTDTVNGIATPGAMTLSAPYAYVELISDGVNSWTIVDTPSDSAGTASTTLTGDVSGTGTGVVPTTVNTIGGQAIGTATFHNIGTSGANVPLMSGTNTWTGTNTFGTITATTITAGNLGTAASANTGTSGHTLPYLNTANTWSAAQSFTTVTASNLGTASAAATGTSGHTLPYLDGANTWSGTNTFGALTVSASATIANLHMNPGAANPTTLADGDVWMTIAGLFYQIGSTIIGPLGTGGAGGGPTTLTGDVTGTGTGGTIPTTATKFNGGTAFGSAAGANTGTSGHTLGFLDGANTYSGVQTHNDGMLALAGATSGTVVLKAPPTGGGTLTLPTGTDTLLGSAAVQAVTNKSISGGAIDNTQIGTTTRSVGNFTQVGIGTSTPRVELEVTAATPNIALTDSSAGANLKTFDLVASGGVLSMRCVDDTYSTAAAFMAVSRSGVNTPSAVSFPAAAGISVIGQATIGGNLTAVGAGAVVQLAPTSGGTVVINPASVGTINRMQIGASSPSSGNFTTINGSAASIVVGAIGANYALSGWNQSNVANAGGVIGYTGSAGTTFGICGFNNGGELCSFYGNGAFHNFGLGSFSGALTCAGLTNNGSLIQNGNVVVAGSITMNAPLSFANVSNFAVGYSGGANVTTTTGVFDIMHSGANYFRFFTNQFYPDFDGSLFLGNSARRWQSVWSTTGVIQTSDENEKQDIRPLNTAEQAVAVRLKALLTMYRWKDQVASQGASAKLYCGIIAQRVEEAFTAEGLDPNAYSMWSKDALGDWEPVEGGDPIFHPNGQFRYSVDYNQILAFIIAAS